MRNVGFPCKWTISFRFLELTQKRNICDLRREKGGVYSTAEERKGEKIHGVKSAGCYSHATPRILFISVCVFVDVENLPVLPSVNVSIPAMRAACLDKRGMESKKMGREWGGRAEVHVRGASVWGG